MSLRHRHLSLLPAIICWLVITILSVTGKVNTPKFSLIGADKIGHAIAYFSWTFLILWGLAKKPGFTLNLGSIVLVFLFTSAYGTLMEWVQLVFCPGRFFEYDDMLANAVGALLASLIAFRVLR
ncbi:MAG: VanZ family protein [Saprospiraceae bacterium]